MFILSSDPNQSALQLWALSNVASPLKPLAPGPDGVTPLPASGQLLLSRLSVLTPAVIARLLESGVDVVTCDGIDTRASAGVGPLHREVVQRVLGSFAGWLLERQAAKAAPVEPDAEVLRLQEANATLAMRVAVLQEELAKAKAPPLGPAPADFDDVPKKPAVKRPANTKPTQEP